MVPFRAIAEALGAEVRLQRRRNHRQEGRTRRCAFSLGGKQLTITDDSTGKVIKTTVLLDSAPYKKKAAALMFRCAFSRKRFGLTVQWENRMCRPPCCMTALR